MGVMKRSRSESGGSWKVTILKMIFALWFAVAVRSVTAGDSRVVVSLTGEKQLAVFSVNDSGKMAVLSKSTVDSRPAAIQFDESSRHLYVACSDPNAIAVYRFMDDRLTHMQTVNAPAKPSYLAVTPGGRFLVACYYKTGQVTVHRISDEGRLSEEPLQTREGAPNAHCVAIDRSGEFVFVPRTRPNCIDQFRLDSQSGELAPNTPASLQRDQPVGPRHLWFHPAKDLAYGSNEKGRSVSVYRFDRATGTLHEIQTIASMPDDVEGKATTSHVEVHPSGRYVYIANRGHGSLAVFAVEEETGRLSLLQRVPIDKASRSFNVSPDGRFVVVSDPKSSNMYCYRVEEDGKLVRTESLSPGEGPW